MTMAHAKAAILYDGAREFRIEDVDIGELRPDELRIRVLGTGVCHTDELFRSETYPFPRPCILGHEGAGIVAECGELATEFEIGDHVILSVMYCGTCQRCKQGQHYLCENIYSANFGGRTDGTNAVSRGDTCIHSHFDGQSSFATMAVSNVKNTIKVRKDAPLHLLGPLGCGFRTGLGAVINTFAPKPGESIVIYGIGSVGMSAVVAAKLAGCHPIVAVDPNVTRRELALELGATHVFDSATGDLPTKVAEVTQGGALYGLDTTGNPGVIRQTVESTGVGGFIGILGGSALGTELVLDANHLLFGGRRIQGINMGDAVAATFIPRMVDLFMDGLLPLDKLITEYPFEEINQAFADTKSGKCLKAVLRMPEP